MPRIIAIEWDRDSGILTPAFDFRLKRTETVTLVVTPKRDRVAEAFATGWALTASVKVKGATDDNPLVSFSSFTDNADGTYSKSAKIEGALIDTALAVNADSSDDLADIDIVLDLSLSISAADPDLSGTLAGILEPNVTRSGDASPTPSATGTYAFLQNVTGYTGGGSTNLDGIVTAGRTFGLVQFIHATEGLRSYHLVAGTTAEASPGYIRPDDYHATTNAYYWESV